MGAAGLSQHGGFLVAPAGRERRVAQSARSGVEAEAKEELPQDRSQQALPVQLRAKA